MASSNSGKHARKVTLDAAVNNAISKAVKARKVAAFTVGAAGVLAGAAFAFGATPAMAAEADALTSPAPAPVTDISDADIDAVADAAALSDDDDNNNGAADGDSAGDKDKQSVVNPEDDKSKNPATTDDNKGKATAAKRRPKRDLSAENQDRAGNNGDTKEVDFSSQKGGMPNVYGFGTVDNQYDEQLANNPLIFKLPKQKDASGADKDVTRVAVFPSPSNHINTSKTVKSIDFDSDNDGHQPYSGEYVFEKNGDGSATLTMNRIFRKDERGASKGIKNAQGYSATRSIQINPTPIPGSAKEDAVSNQFRAALLVPPKSAGTIVKKVSDTAITENDVNNAMDDAKKTGKTTHVGKSGIDGLSLEAQIQALSNFGGRAQDTIDKKIPTSGNEYDKSALTKANSKVGVSIVNTHFVTDLGFKSQAIPLTIVRYNDVIDKPIVNDPSNLSEDVKEDIKKKLAKINGVTADKISFDGDNAVINFDGVNPNDAPKIAVRDLVLKNIPEASITVPKDTEDSAVKAVPVYNPIGFSNAELDRIKQSILNANKNNTELGLTSKDQIKLDWYSGNTAHWINDAPHRAISSGMAENTITVTIKTDKAYVQFKSDIKHGKLTRVVDIRKDYNLEWTKPRMDGRDTDEGFSWSSDKNTLIYRYDATKAQKFNTEDVVKYLKATPKEANSGLRTIIGGETLASEGRNGKGQRSNIHYLLDDQDNPTTSLTMGNMGGPYWNGNPAIDNSDRNLDDHNSDAKDYSFGQDAKVNLAAKSGKVYPAHLYLSPYDYSYYKYAVSVNSINLLFVPQPSHDKTKLKASIDEYTTAQVGNQKVPTKSKYYNASDTLRNNYDAALTEANNLYKTVKDTAKDNLTEQQKADIDNAAIKLNKAYEALNGEDTNKTDLNKDITDQGTAATAQGSAATGTHATDRYKNVANPQFKKADGSPDTEKNNKATQAKTAYDEALAEANKVKENQYATQKEVDAAKEKLDKARRALDEFETNKDKLSEIIASDAKVKTGTSDDISTADPAYQNATEEERNKYNEAVKKAQELFANPNASQAEVDLAIENLKTAKKAIDAKATNKSVLDAQVLQSHDHDGDKKSVFYKNGTYDSYFDNNLPEGVNKEEAKKYASKYDEALEKAKEVINNPKATQAHVDEALNNLKKAEENLHKLKTNSYDLIQTMADNFSGNKLPAYFNAYEESQNGADAAKKTQAGEDFVAYNEAYAEAKTIKQKIDAAKAGTSTYSQQEIDAAKAKLDKAHDAIVTYATKPSALQTSADQDDVTKGTTAYKNAKALADKASDTTLTGEEKTKATEAKNIVDEYTNALAAAKKVLENKVDKDKDAHGQEITKLDGEGEPNSATFLNGVQKHPESKALQKDVDAALKRLDAARAALSAYATKKDDLHKSVDADADTKQLPQYKNTDSPVFKNDSGEDNSKNTQASAAKTAYDQALTDAKNMLAKQDATQAEVDDALKKLDGARKALDTYNTDFAKLQESVGKNGELNADGSAKTEGTLTSDAYRNASNPQFMKADASGNLVPDAEKNGKAAKAKNKYDSALAKAKELLAKRDNANTPAEEKPTQAQVNEALKELDEARTGLDAYKTNAADLKTETEKSKENSEGATATGKFEDTPEFKNAQAKTSDGNENADVTAYKTALANARNLVNAATDTTLSKRPTQKQVDEALEALKNAKKVITDGYKTDVTALKGAKEFANGDFKNTPEYQNASALKDDQKADQTKKDAAKKAVDALDDTVTDSALKKAKDIIDDPTGKTQKEVDDALKTLQEAMNAITDGYKTNTKILENEVGDKNANGDPVTPKFEESIPYKNALEKQDAGDNDATTKLKEYNDKLAAAQDLINKVKNPDSNAAPADRPSQAKVDEALAALKKAKQDIDDNFGTKIGDLKTEVAKSKDENSTPGSSTTPSSDKFEDTPEFKNADYAKDGSDADNADVTAYKEALKKARTLLNKFDENDKPKSSEKDIPTQQEVDDALKALQEIKEKISNKYKTEKTALKNEVAKSKDDAATTQPQQKPGDSAELKFEDSPAFKNAQAKADESSQATLAKYKKALEAAKTVLQNDKASQADVDAALDALQTVKNTIDSTYGTDSSKLKTEYDADSAFTKSPEYVNAQAKGDDASKQALDEYKKALDEANSVLGNENATQTEVDAALKKLEDAKKKLTDGYRTDSSKLKSEADADGDFTKSPEYLNAQSKGDDASKQDLEAYKKALEDANKVLGDANATQAQVDEALKKLQDAKKKLTDSHKTDKAALQTESDADGDFTKTPEYQNAVGSPEAEAYKKALDEANSVLKDPQATQAQVDAALKKLQDAKRVINDEYATQKQALKDEVAKSKDDSDSESDGQGSGDSKFEDSLAYKNAVGTPELDEYKRALEDARRVLEDPHATRSAVLAALTRLQEIKRIIIEKYSVDKSALRSAVDSDPLFRKSTAYIVAETRDLDSYKQAFEEAKRVLDAVNINQAQIDEVLQRLEEAKRVIIDKFNSLGNGGYGTGFGTGIGYGHLGDQNPLIVQSVDKSGLQQIIDDALRVVSQHSEAYKRLAGSLEVKRYDDALANAQGVVADANASRDMVNTAGAELRDASGVLLRRIEMYEGKGNRGGKIANTGAGVSLFAWASAIFAGLGFTGVSRRRKHSDK